ncbi:MAG: hypothetical protein ACXWFI_01905 [Methylobacter sp.]
MTAGISGTGAEDGAIILDTVSLAACSSKALRRLPSPKSVAETMNKTVDITRIKNLSGFFKKNKGHFGLIIPTIKKIRVQIPV